MASPSSASWPRDSLLLFAARAARMFAYGLISVGLVIYLADLGLADWEIGLLLSLTLAGDTLISLWLTSHADRFGRRKTLLTGAVLMAAAGIVFAATGNFYLLLFAATIGVISPSGNEIGPFLSVEQASLSHIVSEQRRTYVFAWYNLVGSCATALGALVGGLATDFAGHFGLAGAAAYRPVLFVYAVIGIAMFVGFGRLSTQIEAVPNEARADKKTILGLHASRGIVFKLSLLFALDSFGGGFVIQSVIAYWFYVRFQLDPIALGSIFFLANLLAGVSALAAGRIARRIGLVNTMVFTHLPSNVLLVLVPLMPNVETAVALLLARFSISQMDVPTRQAYTMAVVRPDERSAAAGVTAVARSIGGSVSPLFATMLMAGPTWMNCGFYLAGGLKIVYDVLLWRSFAKIDCGKKD